MRPVASKYRLSAPGQMTVDWYIGKRCNFACSYCADFIHDNHSAHVPFRKMKIFVDKITAIYGANIQWSLTGGEPTLNPDFLKLLEYLQDKKENISVCTNGSRSLDYLTRMFALSDCIVLSLHFEHISCKLKEYEEKALALEAWRKERNARIPPEKRHEMQPKVLILRFMALPGFMREIERMSDRLFPLFERVEHRVIRPQKPEFVQKNKEKTRAGFYKWKKDRRAGGDPGEGKSGKQTKIIGKTEIGAKTKVSPDKDNRSPVHKVRERERNYYSEEDRRIMEKFYQNTKPNRKWLQIFFEKENGEIVQKNFYYNDLNYRRQTRFTGWVCHAGLSLLKIAPNGEIFIANCFQGGSLGNIYTLDEKTFQPPRRPVICEKLRCSDPLDLRQIKYREEKYKPLVL